HHPHLQHILSNQDISMLRKGSPSQSHQSIGNSSSSTTASGASTPLSVKEALPRYIWDQKLSSSENAQSKMERSSSNSGMTTTTNTITLISDSTNNSNSNSNNDNTSSTPTSDPQKSTPIISQLQQP